MSECIALLTNEHLLPLILIWSEICKTEPDLQAHVIIPSNLTFVKLGFTAVYTIYLFSLFLMYLDKVLCSM